MLKRGKFGSIQSTFNLQSWRLKKPNDVNRLRVKNKTVWGPQLRRGYFWRRCYKKQLTTAKIKGTQGKIPVPTFRLGYASYLHEVTVLVRSMFFTSSLRVKRSLPPANNTAYSTWYPKSACRARAWTDLTKTAVKKCVWFGPPVSALFTLCKCCQSDSNNNFFIPLLRIVNKLQVKLWPKMNCTVWHVATKSSGVLSGLQKSEVLLQNKMAIIGQVQRKRRKQKMHISELKHNLLISFIRKCILNAIPLPKRLSKWPNT